MKMRSLAGLMLGGMLLLPGAVVAQSREYVTHLNYVPAGGQDVQAFFARLNPGDADPTRPGFVFRHDGHGWYREASGSTPPPNSPPPSPNCQTVDPYTQPLLAWVCAIENVYSRNSFPTSFVKMNGTVVEPVLPIVGREYLNHYAGVGRLTVLSLGLTASTPQQLVVTYQYTAGERAGQIGSFTNGGQDTPGGMWKELPTP